MKRTFIFLLSILFSAQVFGQKTEFSLQLGSGFYSFRGKSAVNSSFYLADTSNMTGYTNNPYGRHSSFSYDIALQVQKVTIRHFIYGVQAGYESLSSKVKIINYPRYYNPASSAAYPAYPYAAGRGKAILTNEFFNLHPFVGYRMNILNGIKTDLTFGADVAFCLSSQEKATFNSIYGSFDTKVKREKPEPDTRLRVNLNNYYKHIGLTVGYSYGLTNYEKGMIGASPKAYSQMIRLGLIFKF